MTVAGRPPHATRSREPAPAPRRGLRAALALLYLAAGVAHVATPAAFLPIVPDWVPAPVPVIVATGMCEIVGAVALMTERWRWWAGTMLALYAVCVFPANIKHAVENIPVPPIPSTWWYHGPRLALQPVLVWCALFAGRVIDWPFGRRQSPANR